MGLITNLRGKPARFIITLHNGHPLATTRRIAEDEQLARAQKRFDMLALSLRRGMLKLEDTVTGETLSMTVATPS